MRYAILGLPSRRRDYSDGPHSDKYHRCTTYSYAYNQRKHHGPSQLIFPSKCWQFRIKVPHELDAYLCSQFKPDNRVAIGAGVGVGVAAGIAILGAVLFFLRRQRRKTTRAKEGAGHGTPAYVDGKGELDAAHERPIPQELQGSNEKEPQELRTGYNAHEMRADRNAQELRTGFNAHEMGAQAYS